MTETPLRLPSRLDRSTLGDVLGTLHRGGVSGTLEIWEGKAPSVEGSDPRTHQITMHRGMLTEVQSLCRGPRLGDLLVGCGVVGRDVLTPFVSEHQTRAIRLGEHLVLRGLVDRTVVRAALKKLRSEKLDALFGVANAHLRFRPGQLMSAPLPPMAPSCFLFGRPRARDRAARGAHNGTPRQAPGARASAAGRPRSDARGPAFRRAAALLGVDQHATPTELRTAFRHRVRVLHPDRLPLAEQAQASRRLQILNDAFREAMSEL